MDSLRNEIFTSEKFTVFWNFVTKLTAIFMVIIVPFQIYRTGNSALWPVVCGSAASLVPDLGLPGTVAEPLAFGLRVAAVLTLFRYLVGRKQAYEKRKMGNKAAGTGASS